MSQNTRPKHCNYCGKALLIYGSGKHKIYCNRKCKADFHMERQAHSKYMIYLGQIDNFYKRVTGGKQNEYESKH